MIRDNNGKAVKSLEITEELWKKLMQETLSGVIKLLESCEKLLANGCSEVICAGLYTYAVEEYGKILLLKQYNPVAGKLHIIYKNEFLKHETKFDIAIKNLPNECITLRQAPFDPNCFDSNCFDTKNIITDFKARMDVFYADFSDSEKGIGIQPVPSVDKNLLEKAIVKLKTIAFGTSIP